MNKNIQKFLVVAVLIIACVLFLKDRGKEEIKPVVEEKKEEVLKPQKEEVSELDTVYQELAEESDMSKPPGASDDAWNFELFKNELRKASNREINFYGKVIDQNGTPIPGVKIKVDISSRSTSMLKVMTTGRDLEKEKLIIYSDQNGLFSVTDKEGSFLRITDFQKEGYLKSKRYGNLGFRYGQIMKGPNTEGFHHPDSNKPVVYTLWKQGETEELIRHRKKIYFKKEEEQSKWVSLYSGNNKDVYIKVENPGKTEDVEKYGWSVKIKVPNGGVLASDETFLYHAPESGYENEIVFGYPANAENWKYSTGRQKYYIKLREGKAYGSYELEILTFSTGNVTIVLDNIIVNPNGSRNLEYDPEKDVTKNYFRR
jgi:hypothetical protein